MKDIAEKVILAFGLAALAVIVLGVMILWWQSATGALSSPRPHIPETYELEPAPVEDWRPDIRHCFDEEEERELWDCVRNDKSADVTSLVTGEGK